MLWQRLDGPGHDACWWQDTSDGGYRLEGAAVFAEGGAPVALSYEVVGEARSTTSGRVTGFHGDRPVDVRVERRGDDWLLDGRRVPGVRGCTDLDLAFTPATNRIPLRRLALAVGAEADAPAAWLRFPELDLMRLDQHYRRLERSRFAYRAPALDFAATIEVDERLVALDYPPLWRAAVGPRR
jgi:hypothetical protein